MTAQETRTAHHPHHDHGGQGASGDWDARYQAERWPDTPDPVLVELVRDLTPGRAIDLGSGPGRNGVWLARQGWEVTCVDASPVGLDQACERAAAAGATVHTELADLTSYVPPEGAFDLIVIANIHFHPPERERLFAAAARALAPGGHVFVVGHHLDSLGIVGPPDPDRLLTEEILRDGFPGFDVERLGMTGEGETGEHGHGPNVVLWARKPA